MKMPGVVGKLCVLRGVTEPVDEVLHLEKAKLLARQRAMERSVAEKIQLLRLRARRQSVRPDFLQEDEEEEREMAEVQRMLATKQAEIDKRIEETFGHLHPNDVDLFLKGVWELLEFPPDSRIAMIEKYAGMEYQHLIFICVSLWKQVAVAVLHREAVMQCLRQFEYTASDPQRYHDKISSYFLRESHKRSMLLLLLQARTDEIHQLAKMMSETIQDRPAFQGEDYLDVMRNDYSEMLYQISEARRLGSANWLQEMAESSVFLKKRSLFAMMKSEVSWVRAQDDCLFRAPDEFKPVAFPDLRHQEGRYLRPRSAGLQEAIPADKAAPVVLEPLDPLHYATQWYKRSLLHRDKVVTVFLPPGGQLSSATARGPVDPVLSIVSSPRSVT